MIEARARDKAAAEKAERTALLTERAARLARGEKLKGQAPASTESIREAPAPTDQYNYTDPGSRIMSRAERTGAWRQTKSNLHVRFGGRGGVSQCAIPTSIRCWRAGEHAPRPHDWSCHSSLMRSMRRARPVCTSTSIHAPQTRTGPLAT